MQRVVTVIGGGTGSFNLLSGLKHHQNLDIQSIVTMMDSGGDSGRLRDEFGVLPPGDARRCLVALSEETQLLRDLFSYRFNDSSSLQGRSFGNLFFLALTQILESEEGAIKAIERILKIRGKVIAVTLDHSHLCAELVDGTTVFGEGNIDLPKHDISVPIRRVYLKPEANANREAVDAIKNSDFVVLAPGNLFTSTIPNLLVKGIPEALQQTRAQLVYVMNFMTIHGETYGYTASHHVEQIKRYAGRVPDAVVVHRGKVPNELVLKYRAQEASQVKIDIERLFHMGVKNIKSGDLMCYARSFVRHDPERTAETLVELFEELTPSHRSQLRLA